jgi:hypothetical protein
MKEFLENILSGYTYPEKYFRERLKTNAEKFFSILRDPSIPLLEIKDILSNISERIPKEVEKQIQTLIKHYSNNLSSFAVQFPSQSIVSILDNYALKFKEKKDRDTFYNQFQSLIQLAERYRYGIKGHMKRLITDVIQNYIFVEKYFQSDHYDKCITQLRDKHKFDMSKVTQIVFSHANYQSKNALLIILMDYLFEKDLTLTEDLTDLLYQLTSLTDLNNSKVALKARQILLNFQQPLYELRHNQMESILLSVIDSYGHYSCSDNIQVNSFLNFFYEIKILLEINSF